MIEALEGSQLSVETLGLTSPDVLPGGVTVGFEERSEPSTQSDVNPLDKYDDPELSYTRSVYTKSPDGRWQYEYQDDATGESVSSELILNGDQKRAIQELLESGPGSVSEVIEVSLQTVDDQGPVAYISYQLFSLELGPDGEIVLVGESKGKAERPEEKELDPESVADDHQSTPTIDLGGGPTIGLPDNDGSGGLIEPDHFGLDWSQLYTKKPEARAEDLVESSRSQPQIESIESGISTETAYSPPVMVSVGGEGSTRAGDFADELSSGVDDVPLVDVNFIDADSMVSTETSEIANSMSTPNTVGTTGTQVEETGSTARAVDVQKNLTGADNSEGQELFTENSAVYNSRAANEVVDNSAQSEREADFVVAVNKPIQIEQKAPPIVDFQTNPKVADQTSINAEAVSTLTPTRSETPSFVVPTADHMDVADPSTIELTHTLNDLEVKMPETSIAEELIVDGPVIQQAVIVETTLNVPDGEVVTEPLATSSVDKINDILSTMQVDTQSSAQATTKEESHQLESSENDVVNRISEEVAEQPLSETRVELPKVVETTVDQTILNQREHPPLGIAQHVTPIKILTAEGGPHLAKASQDNTPKPVGKNSIVTDTVTLKQLPIEPPIKNSEQVNYSGDSETAIEGVVEDMTNGAHFVVDKTNQTMGIPRIVPSGQSHEGNSGEAQSTGGSSPPGWFDVLSAKGGRLFGIPPYNINEPLLTESEITGDITVLADDTPGRRRQYGKRSLVGEAVA